MSKQTAVEWLVEQLLANGLLRLTKDEHSVYKELKEQAKAMEREQIIEAHGMKTERDIKCGVDFWHVKHGEQYYNETYKGGEQ